MKPLLTVMLAFCAFSLPVVAAVDAHASDTKQATEFVDGVAKQVMDILHSKASKSSQSKKLEQMISQYVAIDWIGKFVMGQHWRSASKEQQARYLKHYKDFILTSYATRFTEYKGDGYTMLKSRADSADKFTVKMSIDLDGKPTFVDYKLRKEGAGFKIYDLNVEGVSLITTQRSEFNAIIQSKGVDYLIDQLAVKADSLLASVNKK